jgi:ABC-type bacteriocin/lantibiotic exporter with double-glycine peptidase domain
VSEALRSHGVRVAALAATLVACVRAPSTARPVEPAAISAGGGWIAVDGVAPVRQRSALDCGPAALVMVARHWDVPLRLDDATVLTGRSNKGTRLGALRDVARGRGLTAYAIRGDRDTLRHELERGRPVVVGLLRRIGGRKRLSHFEVVVGVHPRRGEVATIDPAAGLGVRRWSDLEAEWEPAGYPALVILGPRLRAGAAHLTEPSIERVAETVTGAPE